MRKYIISIYYPYLTIWTKKNFYTEKEQNSFLELEIYSKSIKQNKKRDGFPIDRYHIHIKYA